jgi:hypothetical protein
MAKYISRYRLAASPFLAYVSVATFRLACKEYRRHRGLFSCAASHCYWPQYRQDVRSKRLVCVSARLLKQNVHPRRILAVAVFGRP